MNHLLRELAPLTGNEWNAIDEEAKQTLKMNLSARRLVDFSGPHGWQKSSINLAAPIRPTARCGQASRRGGGGSRP
jgi:uncharacterized linocin/CFP29 family protein